MKYILYNPLSNNGHGKEQLNKVIELIQSDYEVKSIIETDILDLCQQLASYDEIVIVGGDGTLNRFINALEGFCLQNKVYLFPSGTGNDFLKDIDAKSGELIDVTKYLKDLPFVEVKNKKYRFINGVGFGIDGYCCEQGDILREKSTKEINYTNIAIKGILFFFKNVNAKVEVDGEVYEFKNVWLAPTMKGRFYGGGMKIAPEQNRLSEDKKVSVVIYKTWSRLKALMVFPSVFKGEHVKNKKMVKVLTGNHIRVTFSKPTALQIDGETISDVLTYEVSTNE